jgi:hypothetical protein
VVPLEPVLGGELPTVHDNSGVRLDHGIGRDERLDPVIVSGVGAVQPRRRPTSDHAVARQDERDRGRAPGREVDRDP